MECTIVDPTLIRVLEGQVETLTTSGKPHLDETVVKDLKKILKQSDEYVKHCFYLLLPLMGKDHSEIRLSAFQVLDQIFNRSHTFRELVIENFQHLMEMALETDQETPLPPPKMAAKQLKREAMRAVHTWHEKFASIYKKLALGYNYLKNCKKIDFVGMQWRTLAERRREEEQNRRKEAVEREKINTALAEIDEMKSEMKACITQAENCLLLLLPEPEMFSIHGLHRQRSSNSNRSSNRKQKRKSSAESGQIEVAVNIKREISPEKEPNHTVCDARICAVTPKAGQVNAKETAEIPRGLTSVLGEIKCEFCKVKGCSPSCSQYTLKSNATNCSVSESSKSGPSSQIVDQQGLRENSPASDVHKDTESEHISIKQEPTASDDKSDSDDFQEISSDDDISDDGDGGGSDASGGEGDVIKKEDYGDSDLEDVLETMAGIRDHGVASRNFSLEVQLGSDVVEVEESADNEDVLRSLNDSMQLIQHRFLPAVQRWIQVFTKCGDETQIKLCLDTKHILNQVLTKVTKLKIKKSTSKIATKEEEMSDSEDEFEEVASKDGYEADIPGHLKSLDNTDRAAKPVAGTSQEWRPYNRGDLDTPDPTTCPAAASRSSLVKGNSNARLIDSKNARVRMPAGSNTSAGPGGVVTVDDEQEASRKDKLLQQAPALPYNTDLHYWGEKIEQPLRVNYHTEHRFWTPNHMDSDEVDKDALAAMTSRLINFTGKFEPVSHQCRAPMPNGKLCPRMDRVKCPFHGKIVPRDGVGNPLRREDREEAEKKEKAKEVPAWEDEELQKEIEAATGKSLQRQKKKKRSKKKEPEYPNLTDIKTRMYSGRARLEKKIFNPKTMKRVAKQLDVLDQKRAKDKFGNQFHYALTNRR